MDTAQWPKHQVVGLSRTMEELPTPNSSNNNNPINSRGGTPQMLERRARPQKDQNLNCPRCNSTNTKFCYYNNYSLTQPRYFCKTCRRYWTQGGSLRNVPVGGGSRKNKRSSSSSILPSSSTTSSTMTGNPTMATTKLIPDLNPPTSLSHLLTASQNPKFLEGQDLNLAFPIQGIFQPLDHQMPKIEGNNNTSSSNNNNENHEPVLNMNHGNINSTTTTCTTTTVPLSALELLRTGIASRGRLNSYVPMPMPDSNTLYPSGFPNLQEFKPNMQPTHHHHHHHHHHGSHDNSSMIGSGAARLLFPFADMNKLASSTTTNQHHEIHEDDQNKGGNDHHHHHNQHHHQGPSSGYWTGMLGGGTW